MGDINIQLPEIKLPDITFPSFDFELPEIKLPELPSLPEVPTPDVSPERMDVPFDVPGREDLPPIDIVPDVTGGRAERLAGVIDQEPAIIDPLNPAGLIGDIAQAIIPETQAEFQERALSTAEFLPETFFSTSLTDEITFGRQLSRESENFQDVLAAEANRSEAIFAALFGNVQNPNF